MLEEKDVTCSSVMNSIWQFVSYTEVLEISNCQVGGRGKIDQLNPSENPHYVLIICQIIDSSFKHLLFLKN